MGNPDPGAAILLRAGNPPRRRLGSQCALYTQRASRTGALTRSLHSPACGALRSMRCRPRLGLGLMHGRAPPGRVAFRVRTREISGRWSSREGGGLEAAARGGAGGHEAARGGALQGGGCRLSRRRRAAAAAAAAGGGSQEEELGRVDAWTAVRGDLLAGPAGPACRRGR